MAQPSGILYRDCNKLPLDIFQDCLINSDLSGLGSGPELEEVWDKLYVQSCELSNSGQYNEVFEIMKEIHDLRAKITIADNCIVHLQMQYDPEIVAVLNVFTLKCDVLPDDSNEVYLKKLRGVVARSKKWIPMLKKAQKDLDVLRQGGGEKVTYQYFNEWLDIISESKGYHVEAGKITVARFYLAVNKIVSESQKNEMNAHTKNR